MSSKAASLEERRRARLRARAVRDAEYFARALADPAFKTAYDDAVLAADREDQRALNDAWDVLAARLREVAPDFLRLEREHASDVLHGCLAYEVALRRGLTPEQATGHARRFDPTGLYLSPQNLDHFWMDRRFDSHLDNSQDSQIETAQFRQELRLGRVMGRSIGSGFYLTKEDWHAQVASALHELRRLNTEPSDLALAAEMHIDRKTVKKYR